LHDSPHLKKFLRIDQYEEVESNTQYIKTEDTHHWEPENLSEVIKLKNYLIHRVLTGNYDYFIR